MVISVDFDGTICKRAWPGIGEPVPGAIGALRELRKQGCDLTLFTCRAGKAAVEAWQYCQANGIEFAKDLDASKPFAHMIVDDSAVGCPLVVHEGEDPYVDWPRVLDRILNGQRWEEDQDAPGTYRSARL